MTDIYTDIAKKFNVRREDVKALAFPHMYSLSSPTEGVLRFRIEQDLRLAIRMGFVRTLPSKSK